MGTDYVKQSVSGGFDTTATINQNFTDIETSLGRSLNTYGDTTTGTNAMQVSLDMNSNKVINALDADNNGDLVTKRQLDAYASAALGTVDSSATTYTPGGTGANDTTVQGELRKTFYLSNYDTLQEALTAAGGNLLYVDVDITIAAGVSSLCPDNTTVRGYPSATITSSASVSDLTEVIGSGDNCNFYDLTFVGSVVDAAGYCAIDVIGKTNVTIQGCHVTGHGEAFVIDNSSEVRALNNHVDGTQRFSISCAKITDCLIANNFVTNCVDSDGIKVRDKLYSDAVTEYESSRNLITGNRCIDNDQDGIDFTSGGNSNVISNNICKGNGVHGIQSKPNTATESLTIHSIKGNTCVSNGFGGDTGLLGSGIRTSFLADSGINNNLCSQNNNHGIQASSSSDGACVQVDIRGNHCDSNVEHGIVLVSDSTNRMTDIDVDGNFCIDNGNNTDNGIQWDGYSDRILITNNKCYQRTSSKTNAGIHCSGTTSITGVIIANNYCPQDQLTNTSEVPISMGSYSGDGVISKNNVTHTSGVYSFTDADATPSVAGANEIYVTANTGATSITSFDKHSYETSKFTVHVNDANTTFVNGSSLKLDGSKNWTAPTGSMITFITRNNVVYEVSRIDPTNQAYTPTNVTPDRAYDADSTTTAELADIVGTLISDLQAKSIIS